MSGHNALQSEGTGSTNDRLDSILDALSALGDSSRPATPPPATVHQLHAVPDLVEDESEHTFDATVAETAAPVVEAAPVATEALVPPAVPTFEDALPEADSVAPAFEDVTSEVEEAPTTMPFAPETVVTASDPIESVTPVAEAPTTVESDAPDSVFSTDHVFDTTSLSHLSEASYTDATVFDAAPVEAEPHVEVETPFEVEEQVDVALQAEVDAEPQIETEPAVFVLEPETFDMPPVPEAVAEAEASPATDEANAIVSMLEVDEPAAQAEVMKPASIFRTTPATEATEPIPSLDVMPSAQTPTDDDDWVSHHVPAQPAEAAQVSNEATPDLFTALAATPDESPQELSGDALWHVDVVESSPEELAEVPDVVSIEEPAAVEELSDPWAETATHSPAEEAETEAEVVDFFSMNPPEATESDSGFVTDEELPIPDFTGVYDETPEGNVWDMEATASGTIPLAEGEASKTAATARRAELDKLRPQDEEEGSDTPEGGELLAKEKSNDDSGKVVMVVLCGLVALAFIFVDDPGFLAFFEDLFNQFRG